MRASPQLWRHRPWPEHLRAHRQAHGRPHRAAERLGVGSTFEVSIPLAGADGGQTAAIRRARLTDQSIMLVSPQSIEASLIARRLHAGAARPAWSDIAVALALLPERSWHAVLFDHALGAERNRAAGRGRARPRHAADPDVHAGRATRLQSSDFRGLHRLSDQTVRAASLAARLTMLPQVWRPISPAIPERYAR